MAEWKKKLSFPENTRIVITIFSESLFLCLTQSKVHIKIFKAVVYFFFSLRYFFNITNLSSDSNYAIWKIISIFIQNL